MSSKEKQRQSLYPNIDNPNPNPNLRSSSSSSSLYPKVNMSEIVDNLFPDDYNNNNNYNNKDDLEAPPSVPPVEVAPVEETLISVPGAVVHLIDKKYSVELAIGEFSIVRLRQGENVVAFLARVSDELQWPLVKEEAIVKVDDSHYFFSISGMALDRTKGGVKGEDDDDDDGDDVLNYGVSFASKGQEGVLRELDRVFESLGNFTVRNVEGKVVGEAVTREMTPEELVVDEVKREDMERKCGAYWTILAPKVEDYNSSTAKLIASGTGQLVKGILWCGDATVDGLNWGQEVLRKRLDPAEKKVIDKKTLKRLQRAKGMTKMTKKVATGVLTGVVRVSGFFIGSVANSKPGRKFFSLLPGEMVLASLDGFNRICDAVEVAGKEVLSTTSTVTTGLVTHKYGEEAGKATHEGLGAAGHAFGTAWTVFKIRKALNPKGALKPTSLAKSAAKAAAKEYKSQKSKK